MCKFSYSLLCSDVFTRNVATIILWLKTATSKLACVSAAPSRPDGCMFLSRRPVAIGYDAM